MDRTIPARRLMGAALSAVILAASAALAQEANPTAGADSGTPSVPELPPAFGSGTITPEKYYDGGAISGDQAASNIATFDELDFEVFSHQEWERFHENHDENIVVTWPDGHSTTGLDRHIEDLKGLFVYAPDTRIEVHPVRIATDDWTAVMGVMSGTFTEPMTLPDGTVIQPTGKRFDLPMATIGYWQNGVMVHEWLFWDNATNMAQLGIGG